jgi:hypothetical protein
MSKLTANQIKIWLSLAKTPIAKTSAWQNAPSALYRRAEKLCHAFCPKF